MDKMPTHDANTANTANTAAASPASVYAGWEEDRRLLIATIAELSDAELALRAAPHLRTVGHLAAHIVAARARMIHWILGEGATAEATAEAAAEAAEGPEVASDETAAGGSVRAAAGGDDLDALTVWDGFDRPAPLTIRPAAELVLGLEATGRAVQQALTRWTLGDLAQIVEWRVGDEVYSSTRQRMIWNLIRHDYFHHGELALTLGVHGLAAAAF